MRTLTEANEGRKKKEKKHIAFTTKTDFSKKKN